jgi:RNA polymerase sigma-70 factor (ECF subfamily)
MRSLEESSGEPASFTALYKRFRQPLFRFCLSLTNDRELAEDATQEAFVRLHRDLPSLRSKESVRCWLFTVARNELAGAFRRTRHQVPMEEEAADTDTPESIIVHEEGAALVRRMMGELTEEYREVLVLREYEEFSYAEIADITSSSLQAVKSRLFHARQALAGRLRPWYEERGVR